MSIQFRILFSKVGLNNETTLNPLVRECAYMEIIAGRFFISTPVLKISGVRYLFWLDRYK